MPLVAIANAPFGSMFDHPRASPRGLTFPLQPRRLRIAPAGVRLQAVVRRHRSAVNISVEARRVDGRLPPYCGD